MPPKTTRQLILDLLSTREISSAAEISKTLLITPANTRHHLASLEEDGLVHKAGFVQPHRRGRPARLFQLTRSRQEHNLDRLCHVLLTNLRSKLNDAEWHSTLEDLADSLSLPGIIPGDRRHLSLRLAETIKFLNSLHYKARWEAHTTGPNLILGHCPYSAIIDEHPELCLVDGRLLTNLLATEVQQTAKLELSPNGLRHCIFKVSKVP